jgi:hypothetical protein
MRSATIFSRKTIQQQRYIVSELLPSAKAYHGAPPANQLHPDAS